MPAVESDITNIERLGVAYKVPLSEIAALGRGVHAQIKPPVNGFAHLAITASALTTIAAAANRFDLLPFIPAKTITVNQLNLEVTTLLAVATARLGIYSSDAAGLPLTLIQQGATTLDCSTVGDKATAITPVVLSAGTLYWIAIASSSTQAYRGVALASCMPLPGDATANAMYNLRRATVTYTSLPATAPASTLTAAIAPFVRLRVA